MQSEKTGNDKILILKIKIRDNNVYFEYKDNDFIKKAKINYSTYESNHFNDGEIDRTYLNLILSEDLKNNIKSYLINLIVRKPFSKMELEEKAKAKFPLNIEEINEVIKVLEEKKIIDDLEYVYTYFEYFTSSFYGKYYIINFFKDKGIKDEIIEKLEFNDEKEVEKANKYFELIKNKYVSNNVAKQKKKISELMLSRGFDLEIINDLLSSLKIDQNKEFLRLEKEFQKACEKYKKEIGKKDLITSYLVNRGYNLSDVETLINKENKDERKND